MDINLLVKFLLVCIIGLTFIITVIFFYKNKNTYLSHLLDKISTGAMGGIFVSWMINIKNIITNNFYAKIHIITFILVSGLLLLSVITKKDFKLKI
jgi:uncharacterized membrane protein